MAAPEASVETDGAWQRVRTPSPERSYEYLHAPQSLEASLPRNPRRVEQAWPLTLQVVWTPVYMLAPMPFSPAFPSSNDVDEDTLEKSLGASTSTVDSLSPSVHGDEDASDLAAGSTWRGTRRGHRGRRRGAPGGERRDEVLHPAAPGSCGSSSETRSPSALSEEEGEEDDEGDEEEEKSGGAAVWKSTRRGRRGRRRGRGARGAEAECEGEGGEALASEAEECDGMPTVECARLRPPPVPAAAAVRGLPSCGSSGHPHRCALACKYARKARGCKDGEACVRCHLCAWKGPAAA